MIDIIPSLIVKKKHPYLYSKGKKPTHRTDIGLNEEQMWEQFASCSCYVDMAWPLPKAHPLCFCPRFTLLFSFYGIVMSLQSFGIDSYLIQVLFATVNLLFYFLGFFFF